MAAFMLDAMPVNAVFQSALSNDIYSGLTIGVTALGVILYHGRSNLLRIDGNFNSNSNVRVVLQPEVVPFF
ncbi:hypothetical protein TNCV_520511 [Trichonephila clavipes]|nr:hypothetical protein TNCV_520511 [Trichonephila clavipes]